jgi:protein-arginine kinase activator protein McsA
MDICVGKICDGCDRKKTTRAFYRLDPRRLNKINYLCKKCANSNDTIPKLLKWNKKNLPETHSILGFTIEESKKVSSIEIAIFQR